jgi:hypothetical protein
MQGDDRLAAAVVSGLDAGEQQRRLACVRMRGLASSASLTSSGQRSFTKRRVSARRSSTLSLVATSISSRSCSGS